MVLHVRLEVARAPNCRSGTLDTGTEIRQGVFVTSAADYTPLPTTLVARYRAVDREHVGSAIVDTRQHLDALTADIGERGILTPLLLAYNEEFATLDGNHRIAVAIRLGLDFVPVTIERLPTVPRPNHAKPMLREDFERLRIAQR